MTTGTPAVERLRPTPLLVISIVLQVISIVMYLVNQPEQWISPILCWLPSIINSGLVAFASYRVSKIPELNVGAARVWRYIAVVAFLVGIGLIGDARLSVVHPDMITAQQHDVPTTICYAAAIFILLWALLRVPVRRAHSRFAMDSVTLAVTVVVFAWFFMDRATAAGQTRNITVPMLMLVLLGLIGAIATVRIAISGLSGLDRTAVRWYTAAAVFGAGGCGLMPLVIKAHPGLSASMLFMPATMICVLFAADRQTRAAGIPAREPKQRMFSIVPYLAVAATDGLLLWVARATGGYVIVVAAAATFLTVLVAFRQIQSMRENTRLLQHLDHNLAELGRAQDELTHRATHDALTGLANRVLFEQTANDWLAGPTGMSLALIDLDDFKGVNDRLGHQVGDGLLIAVAERLREQVRPADLVARLGGDEFGLLLHDLGTQEAAEVLTRISASLRVPVHALGHDLLAGASIGLAESWDGASQQELLRRADLAMYAAKAAGKGRHAVYDEVLEENQNADAQLGAALRRALDRDEFSLVYQPIVRLPDGHWMGLETLIRWPGADPDQFIPIAERTGLIVPLGDWILRTALTQYAAWVHEFGDAAPAELGVNVSARQLREPGFAGGLAAALTATGVHPGRLVVEVTETAVFDGGTALDAVLDIVRLGVKVALDDFGTGHSSLGLLRTVPAGTLKVDKSFVAGIGCASEEAVIATAMIQITDGLHLQAIAEGVETAEQASTLYRLGYRFAQGFHFARPLPPAEVGAHLALARSRS